MKLIYIEATKEELKENRTLADSLSDTLSGFIKSIIKVKPIIEADYKFKENDDEEV